MDAGRVQENARTTSTEILLDRVTVLRGEFETLAVEIIEDELRARGIQQAEVDAHAAARVGSGLLHYPDGTVIRCTCCPRPATVQKWGWHRLWGWFLPMLLRLFSLCAEHAEQLPTDPHGRTLHYDPGVERRAVRPGCRTLRSSRRPRQ